MVEPTAYFRTKDKSASNGGGKSSNPGRSHELRLSSFILSYGRIASSVSRMLVVILNMMT